MTKQKDEKKEKAAKLKIEINGVKGTFIEEVPNQIITATTTDAQERQLDYLAEKRWRKDNPEPEYTVTLHEKIQPKLQGKSLSYCGHIFSIVIHTNFKQKETGLIVYKGKPAKIKDFGEMLKMKSRDKISATLKALVEDQILRKEGTKYFLNKEYHFMGKLEEDVIFSKLYHVSNRALLNSVSQEAVGLLYKIIPLVNYTNGTVCFNHDERDNEQVKALIREDLAEYLELHIDTVTLRMNELVDNGVILPIQIKNSVYYKVHPDFVAKIDYFTALAIKMMIEEHKAVQLQLEQRRRNKKKKKQEEESE